LTALETLISLSIVSLLLITSVIATRSTVQSATLSVTEGALIVRVASKESALEQLLLSASRATLQGIPSGGKVLEPVQEGVAYDNLGFRRVRGFLVGAPQFDPPVTQNPWRIWLEPDTTVRDGRTVSSGTGTIYVSDGTRTSSFFTGLTSVAFTLQGTKLTIQFARTASDRSELALPDVPVTQTGSVTRTGSATQVVSAPSDSMQAQDLAATIVQRISVVLRIP